MQASIPILNITWIYQNCLIWEHLNIIKAQCGLRMCCTFVVCPICVAGFLFSLLRLCCGFVMCSICVKLGSPLEFITASHFRRGNLNWGFSNSCRVHWTAFCFNMYFYTFIHCKLLCWECFILKIYHPESCNLLNEGHTLYYLGSFPRTERFIWPDQPCQCFQGRWGG